MSGRRRPLELELELEEEPKIFPQRRPWPWRDWDEPTKQIFRCVVVICAIAVLILLATVIVLNLINFGEAESVIFRIHTDPTPTRQPLSKDSPRKGGRVDQALNGLKNLGNEMRNNSGTDDRILKWFKNFFRRWKTVIISVIVLVILLLIICGLICCFPCTQCLRTG